MSAGPLKKRAEPDVAPPVVHKGVRYEAVEEDSGTWGSDPLPDALGTFLVASDATDDRELWRVRLYDTRYDPKMERDKQEVYVTSLSLNLLRTKLKARDEKGRRYVVDLASHAVTT